MKLGSLSMILAIWLSSPFVSANRNFEFKLIPDDFSNDEKMLLSI